MLTGGTQLHDLTCGSDRDLGLEGVGTFFSGQWPLEGLSHLFSTRSRRGDFAPSAALFCTCRLRTRTEVRQQRASVDVTSAVSSVHLEQHTQQVHGEAVPQVYQGWQQSMGHVSIELRPAPLRPFPQEGRALSVFPAGFELSGKRVKLLKNQTAGRS